MTMPGGKDRFLEAWRERGSAADWLAPVRQAAIERFGDLGFPTTKLEDWKYTSVKSVEETRFRAAKPYEPDGLSFETLHARALACGGGPVLTFVDGGFAPDLSRLEKVQPGVRLMTLRQAVREQREAIEPWLGRIAADPAAPFSALNAAFIDEGACLIVPEGTVVESTIHVLFLSSAREKEPVVYHPRVLLVAGRKSQVTLSETYAGIGHGGGFTNAVTEIAAGPGSVIEHYKVQRESTRASHLATVEVHLERDATYVSHSISDGAALSRNDVNVRMLDQGGDCTLNGLYIVSGRQHVDNHTLIDHAKPHCSSRELFKGVLGGSSRGVFDGKIIVRPDAQKSDARQVNNNLLLSDSALVDTKPQLEINADDVKCAHAATIGQLDPDAIFYLRSRALGEPEARNLLVHGFVHEMIERLRIGCLRTGLEGILYGRLEREAKEAAAS